MRVPDLEHLIAEGERAHTSTDPETLRAFLDNYHRKNRHLAWFSPVALQLGCVDAVKAVDNAYWSAHEQLRHEQLRRAGALYEILVRRFIKDHPGVDPPYSTQVICGYIQEMLDARTDS